jgi:hypothetical protein
VADELDVDWLVVVPITQNGTLGNRGSGTGQDPGAKLVEEAEEEPEELLVAVPVLP